MNLPARGVAKKLPVWLTIESVCIFFFPNQRTFWRIAALPMASYYSAFVIVHVAIDEQVAGSEWTGDLLDILLFILLLPFIVAWHRFVLLGPNSVVGHRGLRYGRREGKFLLVFLSFGLFLGILQFIILVNAAQAAHGGGVRPQIGLDIILFVIIFLIVLSPIFRLFLVLPSIALDKGASLRNAWKLTKGNTIRITAVFAFAVSPVLVIFDALIIPAINLMPHDPAMFLGGAITMYKEFIIAAVVASSLSLSYKFLISAKDNDTVSPTDA